MMSLSYKLLLFTLLIAVQFLFPILAPAQEDVSSLPLPTIGVEGFGGLLATYAAYLTNPPAEGDIFGLPSFAYAYVNLGHSRDLNTFGITETLWNRLELGYAYIRMDLGDLPEEIARTGRQLLIPGGLSIDDDTIGLHNFNARLALLHEGEWDLRWLPAVTAGVHYKYNDTIDDLNDDLTIPGLFPQGAIRSLGIESDDGVDFTLYATKTMPDLPLPMLFNIGLRATKAAHIGLFGFTEDYNVMVEGSLFAFLSEHLLVGGEYRMKPDEYDQLPAAPQLIEKEDDLWTLYAAYLINKNLSISAGYGHFGDVFNHKANGAWAIRLNWEF